MVNPIISSLDDKVSSMGTYIINIPSPSLSPMESPCQYMVSVRVPLSFVAPTTSSTLAQVKPSSHIWLFALIRQKAMYANFWVLFYNNLNGFR